MKAIMILLSFLLLLIGGWVIYLNQLGFEKNQSLIKGSTCLIGYLIVLFIVSTIEFRKGL